MRDASPHDNPEPSAWEARLQALLAEVDAIDAQVLVQATFTADLELGVNADQSMVQ